MARNDVDGAEKQTFGVHEIRVFLCYRRQDGAWHADWLYRQLNNTSYVDADGNNCQIHIYYDKTAPGVSDWKQLHFPSLQTSRAMILVCTPGIAIDFSRRSQPDWVYEELRWWCGHRDIAPIVVDATNEGDRWLPKLITDKWPDINRIDLSKDDAAAAEGTDINFVQRIRERITGAIRESERRTVFEDLQRFKQLTKRLAIALSCAVVLFIVAAIAAVFALYASSRAEKQQKIAEEQKGIVQEQVVKLLFLPDTEESDQARDAFYKSLGGPKPIDALLALMDGAIKFKSNPLGVTNALKILECYGPYRGEHRAVFDPFFSELAPVEDKVVKFHLEMLRTVVDADLSGRPRPKNPERCQWLRGAAPKGNNDK